MLQILSPYQGYISYVLIQLNKKCAVLLCNYAHYESNPIAAFA